MAKHLWSSSWGPALIRLDNMKLKDWNKEVEQSIMKEIENRVKDKITNELA